MSECKIYRYALAGLIIVSAVALALPLASAFTVSPGRVEITLPAGESCGGSFTVGNPGDTAVKVRVTVEDWSSAQEGREITKREASSLEWLAFSDQELTLGPNRSDIISYTVTLPEEARGEYIAMVYFATVPEPSKKGISVISRIGNALYVAVEGTEVVKGQISKIVIGGIDLLQVDVTVRNEGNIHIRPRGKIIIRKKGLFLSRKDREPIEILFNKTGFPIFPQQEDVFAVSSKERLNPGRYKLELTIEFGPEIAQKELSFTVTRKGEVIENRPKN